MNNIIICPCQLQAPKFLFANEQVFRRLYMITCTALTQSVPKIELTSS